MKTDGNGRNKENTVEGKEGVRGSKTDGNGKNKEEMATVILKKEESNVKRRGKKNDSKLCDGNGI